MTDHLQQVREKLHTLRGKDLAATAQRVGASYDTILRIRDGTTSAPSYSLVMALDRALKRVKVSPSCRKAPAVTVAVTPPADQSLDPVVAGGGTL